MTLCVATMKKGEPCMRHASEGSTLCYLHRGMVVELVLFVARMF